MKLTIALLFITLFWGCEKELPIIPEEPKDPTTEDIVSENFVGIGAQVGGYDDLQTLISSPTLSEEDWEQMFTRLRFMRPGIVRIMGSQGWNYSVGGQYNPQKSQHILFKILDFCQAQNIKVIWGEWGHVGGSSIDENWLNRSIDFLDYLINTKEYSCVKYFTMVNEPNGSWSSIAGNYNLWKTLMLMTQEKMEEKGLLSKVQILAPGISISRDSYIGNPLVSNSFTSNTVKDMDTFLNSYNYHLYPGNDQVENGKFYRTMVAFRKLIPESKDALISELGFSYYPTSPKGLRNAELRQADPHAADNANMMVYESVYGIDISAAIIQLLTAGYKAAVVWRLDDAMYVDVAAIGGVRLTRWGFWNSLGKERFNNPGDENLRPWFYTCSLLSRYFPPGSVILKVVIPDNKTGMYGIAAKKDGKYTIALVNTYISKQTLDLEMDGGVLCPDMRLYKYVSLQKDKYNGETDDNGFPVHIKVEDIDLSKNKPYSLDMEAGSFILLTNME